jgi:hypothetical protein
LGYTKEKLDEIDKNRIFKMIDKIELMTNLMIHESHLSYEMRKWQDGEIKNSQFIITLTNEIDRLKK